MFNYKYHLHTYLKLDRKKISNGKLNHAAPTTEESFQTEPSNNLLHEQHSSQSK